MSEGFPPGEAVGYSRADTNRQDAMKLHVSAKTPLIALLFALSLALGACSSDPEGFAEVKEDPIDQLYAVAMDHLNKREYKQAATAFDEVERQHPYSVWATKAQLMAAFAHYQDNKYDEAIVALDRFIQLHPGHRDIAYAYYLKGLSYYEQISDVGRDQKMTELAMQYLGEVVNRFPESKYARDASLKIDLTRDHLAGKEMEIGRYYLRQQQYLAGINRFAIVVKKYQTTTHVPEALGRMVEAYIALGLDMEAQKVAAVLGHNFPGSPWYQDSYRLVKGITLEPPPDAEGGWFDWVPFVGEDNESSTATPYPAQEGAFDPAPQTADPAAPAEEDGSWLDWIPFVKGSKAEEPPPAPDGAGQ